MGEGALVKRFNESSVTISPSISDTCPGLKKCCTTKNVDGPGEGLEICNGVAGGASLNLPPTVRV